MEPLEANKVGAFFVFFAVSFLGVWTPYFIPVKANVLKFGLLLSSGLFLAMSFMHLARECVHAFEELEEAGLFTSEYPVPWLICVLGFYMTWFADLVAESIWQKKPAAAALPPAETKAFDDGAGELAIPQSIDIDSPVKPVAGPSVAGALKNVAGIGLIDVILLLIGLCFHAFFEGLAVGLASEVSEVWNLTIAICLNEFFEGAALGTTLRAQNVERSPLNFFLYALGASLVAPLGILIGLLLVGSLNEDATEWAEGIGNGLAAGVFVCVATRHLIQKAMVPNGPDEAKWMPFAKFFVSGLGVMINSLTTLKGE